MTKTEFEQGVKDAFGIEIGQVYLDKDKRMYSGNRKVRVVGLAYKPGKATCEHYIADGWSTLPVTYISFKRLSNKKLFTKLDV